MLRFIKPFLLFTFILALNSCGNNITTSDNNELNESNELLYGIAYKQLIRKASWETDNIKEIAFSLGIFSRLKDAIVLKSMVFYGPLSVGFAYDINVSRLSLVSNFKGGFETFVRYDLNNFNRKKLRVK